MVEVSFRVLPGRAETVARPLVDVYVAGIERTGLACLVDTGALRNRFGQWVADIAGLELDDAEVETFALGGHLTTGRTIDVDLRMGNYFWRAPVSFCDPWPWDFQLLGQEGFLRYFDICVSAAALQLQITPAPE